MEQQEHLGSVVIILISTFTRKAIDIITESRRCTYTVISISIPKYAYVLQKPLCEVSGYICSCLYSTIYNNKTTKHSNINSRMNSDIFIQWNAI